MICASVDLSRKRPPGTVLSRYAVASKLVSAVANDGHCFLEDESDHRTECTRATCPVGASCQERIGLGDLRCAHAPETAFTRYVGDRRIKIDNNAAERAPRGLNVAPPALAHIAARIDDGEQITIGAILPTACTGIATA